MDVANITASGDECFFEVGYFLEVVEQVREGDRVGLQGV
jgi:hypothetical protein